MINFLKYSYLFFVISIQLKAQNGNITGIVKDSKTKLSVSFSNIALYKAIDSTLAGGAVADDNGHFEIQNVTDNNYYLKISFLGYETFQTSVFPINQGTPQKDWGTIYITPTVTSLKTVSVETQQTRVEQKGDTTQFNANAFKTNPDATAEDLIKKMPGVTTDGNTVKVNGEEVKKVLVDGKPFFGDDPTASLRNFPADVIDKVQVFDKASEQAQFTGFRDGNEEKTINLITKSGKSEGLFGKVYGGYGTDDKYNAGFTLNSFKGARRISVIGMSNNINQQNFNISDIMSVMSNSGSSGGGMGGPPPQGSAAASFFSGQQSGITRTSAIGINYVDTWGKKVDVSGNYFFNQTDNSNLSNASRSYYTQDELFYNQTSNAKTKNINHKINLKINYTIDSANAITLTPRLTVQGNQSSSQLIGNTLQLGANSFTSQTNTVTLADNTGYNFTNDLLLQHKFNKKGRTISLNVNTQLNNRNGTGSYYSSITDTDTLSNTTLIDRDYNNINTTNTLGTTLSYTEPIAKNGQLMISYSPSITQSNADKTTRSIDNVGDYSIVDSSLSNKYTTDYTIQKAGLNYLINTAKTNLNIGTDLQQATLSSNGVYPTAFTLSKTMANLLPSAMLNYKFSRTKNLNINYRAATRIPSVSQLQDVVDISNPLLIKSGNASLKQTYEHNLRMRLGLNNTDKARNFFIFLTGNYINDYISNATYIINTDTTIQGYTMKPGSQFTKPVNLNGYYTIRSFGVYGFPLSAIKSNMNINAGISYTHTPALINDVVNYSDNRAANAGIYLSSNISQSLDFSVAYNGSYNVVRNTIQVQSNNTYFNHTATLKINYILLKRIVINTDINQTYYTGLTGNYNQNFVLWNAYIGYKFLKNQSFEAKVSAYDMLNQNRGISRTITETYFEDSNTQVLKRYFMFTLTYTFKHFKGGAQAPTEPELPKGMPPPGSMPPPPSGIFSPPGN